MASRSNPYAAGSETAPQLPESESVPRWPQRLTFGLIALALFVFCSIPAVQATRSTNLYDRTIGSLESLVTLIFGIIIVPALAISVLRTDASIAARRIARLLLVASLLYDGWLCIELLRGPIRGY